MITTVKPMSTDHARCLAMAYELQQLLGELDAERNPRIEAALDLMDDVVDHLDAAGTGERGAHALRLLVTAPQEYDRERTGRALRLLVSTPWRRP
jgi:hypothetical protein